MSLYELWNKILYTPIDSVELEAFLKKAAIGLGIGVLSMIIACVVTIKITSRKWK